MSVALSTATGACPHTGDSATSRAGPCFPGSQTLWVLDQAASGLSVATAQSQLLLLASHTRSIGSLPQSTPKSAPSRFVSLQNISRDVCFDLMI